MPLSIIPSTYSQKEELKEILIDVLKTVNEKCRGLIDFTTEIQLFESLGKKYKKEEIVNSVFYLMEKGLLEKSVKTWSGERTLMGIDIRITIQGIDYIKLK